MPAVTIVIRARNEEFWMRRLLSQIRIQSFTDYEIVLVDNKSADKTQEIFKKFAPEGKILEIENFKPGKAINAGISAGSAPLAVILSAHCIPVDKNWLASLVAVMSDQSIAAAYGRQVPLATSHPLDKRDLLNTFGIERRVQRKDTFFHNANSIVRRDVWQRFPFDEQTPHIEDRLWAGHIIQNGMAIAYEPDASVYHHHGINHHGDAKRAHVISDILTKHTLENGHALPEFLLPDSSATLYCFLGHDAVTDDKFKTLIRETQMQCPSGRYIVHSQAPQALAGCNHDLEVLVRTQEDNDLSYVDILRKMLHLYYADDFYPDCVVYINLHLDNIQIRRVKDVVSYFYRGMYDSVFYAQEEYRNVWQKNGDSYQQIRPDFSPKGKKNPIYLAHYGQGLATKPRFIEGGKLVGANVAILNPDEDEERADPAQYEGLKLVGEG